MLAAINWRLYSTGWLPTSSTKRFWLPRKPFWPTDMSLLLLTAGIPWAKAAEMLKTQEYRLLPKIYPCHKLGGRTRLLQRTLCPRRTFAGRRFGLVICIAESPKVDRLIGIAPVVSGDLWERSCFKNMPEFCQKWKSDGAYVYQTPDGKDKALISYKTLDDAKTLMP